VAGIPARTDAQGFYRPFAEMHPKVFTTAFDSAIAASAQDLAVAARAAGLVSEPCDNIEQALAKALDAPGPAPHVLICGGLHFAGEVLAMSPDTWPT
jgi:dihydrofolate synthase/folylpolyglutamate synthase